MDVALLLSVDTAAIALGWFRHTLSDAAEDCGLAEVQTARS